MPHAAEAETSYVGDPNSRGTVGEFLVVDARGTQLLARLVSVELSQRDMHTARWGPGAASPDTPSGRAQIIATIRANGSLTPGAAGMPRIGDSIYTASTEVLSAGIGSVGGAVHLGHLSHYADVAVSLDLNNLLGRHLAILGSTGGGKSWTVAHVAETIAGLGGRLIILDATGEYSTLGGATHIVASGATSANCAAMDISEFSDSDRVLLLRPSSGSQLPKMNAAIASLRLAKKLGEEHVLVEDGYIKKAQTQRARYQRAERIHAEVVNHPHAPFDLRKLPVQIGRECVYPTDRNRPGDFGDTNFQEIGWCSSLMTRVEELCRSDFVMDFIAPTQSRTSLLKTVTTWVESGGAGILRIDLSQLPQSNFLREIAVNTIGNRLLDLARKGVVRDNPLVVAVDEAHQYLGRTLGDEISSVRPDSFEVIAKEGRKYGLSLMVATQRPGDLPAGVLSQMGCMIVHRLTEKRDQDHIADASSHLDRDVARSLPALIPGECIIVGSGLPLALPVKLTPPINPPQSEGPRFGAWALTTA